MNILPKKSWHVRTKANIERVRRDEEKAAAEEKEKQRRIAIAEQEARTDYLRKQAAKRGVTSGESSKGAANGGEVEIFKEGKHINFWSEQEAGTSKSGGNADYEREKKEEKEKQEKAIGLLTYLGQSAVEAQTSKPWYFQKPEEPTSRVEHRTQNRAQKEQDEFDRKKKLALDPMRMMTDFLEKKRKFDERDDPDHLERKRKKHKKHKSKDGSREKSSRGKKGARTVEELRAERLRREKAERQRTEALMARLRGEKSEAEKKEEAEQRAMADDRRRGYNSQFNPELARQMKPKAKHGHYQ